MKYTVKDIFGEGISSLILNNNLEEPSIVAFHNSDIAMNILHHAITHNSYILVHCDVDMDGISSGYVIGKYLRSICGRDSIKFAINGGKEHGISQRQVDYFNKSGARLIIIVDSASNDIEYIKKINCDVIVLDHHVIEVHKEELVGETIGGMYCVVNNTMPYEELETQKAGTNLSGCGVVWEFIRQVNSVHSFNRDLRTLGAEQWVGVSIFCDSINTLNYRNQYYINRMMYNEKTEDNLLAIMKSLNISSIDKGRISYSIANVLNATVRAGRSIEALNCVLNKPQEFGNLLEYKKVQDEYLSTDFECDIFDTFVTLNLETIEIPREYSGVIAAKLVSRHNKNAFVYYRDERSIKGSFRGLGDLIDYRNACNSYGGSIRASGHKTAFGLSGDSIEEIIGALNKAGEEQEIGESNVVYASVNGNAYKGIIEIGMLQRSEEIFRIASANGKLVSNDEIKIVYCGKPLLRETRGKAFIYDINGIECVGFEEIDNEREGEVVVYVESTLKTGFKAYISKTYHN